MVRGFGGVDTRVLGKPDQFDGTQSKWKDWSTVARAYFMLVSPPRGSYNEKSPLYNGVCGVTDFSGFTFFSFL